MNFRDIFTLNNLILLFSCLSSGIVFIFAIKNILGGKRIEKLINKEVKMDD